MTIHTRNGAVRARRLAGAVALLLAVAAQGADFSFNIPAGELKSALDAYIKQTGQQIVYKSDDVKGKTTPGVHGTLSDQQALDALLKGTGLQLRRDESGAVVVFPAEAVAGGASATAAGEQKLEEVVVTATAISHLYVTSRSVTRIDADPMDLPISVSTVQEDLLFQQQARTITDVLDNVAGMDVSAANDVTSRGFRATAARNGTSDSGPWGSQFNSRPVVATERVEVVKGPEQIMQGTAAGYGGTVNVITKAPEAQPIAYLGAGAGSREYWRFDVDLNDTLVDGEYGRLMGRLIGSTSGAGDTRVGYDGASNDFVSAGLRWTNQDFGSDLSVVYEYNDYWNPMAPNVVSTGKQFGPGLKQFNFGGPNNGVNSTENTVDVNYTQDLWRDWKFSVNYVWRGGNLGTSTYYAALVDPTTVFAADYSGAKDLADTSLGNTKASVYGTVDTGPVKHNLLIAYDYDTSEITANPGEVSKGFYLTDLTTWTKTLIPSPTERTTKDTETRRDSGILLVDRAVWGPWSAMLGVRWVSWSLRVPSADVNLDDNQTLPQYGLVYEVLPDVSLYASGSEGYSSNAGTRTYLGQPLPDETSYQYEAGVKALLFDRQLALTVALYRIKQQNVATIDWDNYPDHPVPLPWKTIDGITSKGVEVELSGQPIRGLDVRLNYAYLNAEQDDGQPAPWGYTPNKFNLWAQYWFSREVAHGWWAGGGLSSSAAPERPVPESPMGKPPTVPGNTVVDLSAGYAGEHWTAIAGVKNVGDERVYFPTDTYGNFAGVGPGRTYAFDVSYRF
ncbi:MAG: TonB-dependent receptor [Steroidobacteraceae bacterium]